MNSAAAKESYVLANISASEILPIEGPAASPFDISHIFGKLTYRVPCNAEFVRLIQEKVEDSTALTRSGLLVGVLLKQDLQKECANDVSTYSEASISFPGMDLGDSLNTLDATATYSTRKVVLRVVFKGNPQPEDIKKLLKNFEMLKIEALPNSEPASAYMLTFKTHLSIGELVKRVETLESVMRASREEI
jgi:hypothetical protein